MYCPVCREALVVVEREGIELDWCLVCRGLWFDEGELELLAEKSSRRLRPEGVGHPRAAAGARVEDGATPRRKCPRCRRKMERVVAGSVDPVQVDRCTDHGMWLDSGELGRIMAQLEPGGSSDEAVIVRFLGETFGNEPASQGGTK